MSEFHPAPGLIGAVEHSEGVHEVIVHKAEAVAEMARSIAPVLTGAFRASIHTVEDGDEVHVVADSVDEQGNPDAAYIEFGTSDTPAHGTLRSALDAARSL